jgi:hypothetical protein
MLDKKIQITTETDIISLMNEIMDCIHDEDDILELVKLIDSRVQSVDFTKRIYDWAKEELIKEGELTNNSEAMSDEFGRELVSLFNRAAGKTLIMLADDDDDEPVRTIGFSRSNHKSLSQHEVDELKEKSDE